jgi:DeoR family fructose operon transcriptional repressor
MGAEERQHQILLLARQLGAIDVLQTAKHLDVAPETVRRDLNSLQKRGLVRRRHGGAYPVESAGFETDLARRVSMHVDIKRRIAAQAVKLLGEAATVFVDEGYTPQLIAGMLPPGRPLTVVTASLSTAAAVADSPNLTVLLLGGRVRAKTLGSVGPWTSAMLSKFVIDLAFLGANGISRETGLTTPDPAVAEVKATAVQVSQRRVFIGHHGKFGASSFSRFARITDFEAIVTDTGLPSVEAERYSRLGPTVIRA